MEKADLSVRVERLVRWMRDRASEANAKGGVFGVSGGLDSALVLALAKKAWGDSCLGLILPCHSLREDVDDALELVRMFDCPHRVIDLGPTYEALVSSFGAGPEGPVSALALANIKPRLRMISLYYHANLMNYLVVGSSNRDEIYVGYSTKYGDGGVDIQPLASMTKGEVREMSSYLGVPRRIVERVPSAGLWPGQTDEQEMGISYEDLDAYLLGRPVPEDVKGKILRRHRNSEHKRRMPPSPDFV
ncbi:MAG: NAD(+) synthase [Bacillota bacterium]